MVLPVCLLTDEIKSLMSAFLKLAEYCAAIEEGAAQQSCNASIHAAVRVIPLCNLLILFVVSRVRGHVDQFFLTIAHHGKLRGA